MPPLARLRVALPSMPSPERPRGTRCQACSEPSRCWLDADPLPSLLAIGVVGLLGVVAVVARTSRCITPLLGALMRFCDRVISSCSAVLAISPSFLRLSRVLRNRWCQGPPRRRPFFFRRLSCRRRNLRRRRSSHCNQSVLQAAPPPSSSPLPLAPSAPAVVLPASSAPPALPPSALPQLFLGGREIPIPWEVLSTPQPAAAPAASAAALDEPWSRWEECPPVERLRRVKQRVATVGTVLELLASVLDQLHSGLLRGRVACPPLSKRQRAVVVTAARRMMGSFPQMGLETGSPGVGSGPGPSAVRRLASSVRRVPLDLIPAAAALLRWLDGRLALILAD
ncbi:unnamed protein product [Closterium sp. NIES-64]|nr:unnamed protein product [Closterium sp. NIES-64]